MEVKCNCYGETRNMEVTLQTGPIILRRALQVARLAGYGAR